MKKQYIVLVLCLFALTALMTVSYSASYELYRIFDGTTGTNNAIPASSAATDFIQTSKCTNVFKSSSSTCTLFIAFKFSGSGTENVTVSIDRSYDNLHWEAGFASLIKAGNGTTEVTASTNIAAGEYGFFRVSDIDNASARIATNIYLSWSAKQ